MCSKTNHIVTSFYPECLEIEILDKSILFTSIPWYPCFDEFSVEIQDDSGKVHARKSVRRNNCRFDISALRNGKYFVNLYISGKIPKLLLSPLLNDSVMISIENDNIFFMLPTYYGLNKKFIDKIPVSQNDLLKYSISTKGIECHKPEVKSLANEICKFSHNNYNRLLCIHDWIAQNLYYDMDSVNDGSYVINNHRAIEAIKCDKKCVCSDFTYLTVALARSLNIPSICITCKTDEHKECWNGGFDGAVNSDHIFAASYVDNRWVLMDNTWDCGNQILNGKFQKRTNGYDRKYFDVSLEIISSTHRFVKIQL